MTTLQPQQGTFHTFTPLPTQHAGACGDALRGPPTHDQIARCAYDLYVATGRQAGRCQQNWRQAEQALCCQNEADALAQEQSSGAFARSATRSDEP